MKIVTWEFTKKKAICLYPDDEHIINKWDIREAAGLADKYPGCIPRGHEITEITQDRSGNWVLILEREG